MSEGWAKEGLVLLYYRVYCNIEYVYKFSLCGGEVVFIVEGEAKARRLSEWERGSVSGRGGVLVGERECEWERGCVSRRESVSG